MLMFSISLELQFHALRSFFLFPKPQEIVSIKLTCLCIFFFLIYHYPLKIPVNSYSVDFKNRSREKALTSSPTTCCPQNFLATYTVHEPQRGLLCPIACLKAQPVSCVIINPLSPEDTQTERSPSASVHKRLH